VKVGTFSLLQNLVLQIQHMKHSLHVGMIQAQLINHDAASFVPRMPKGFARTTVRDTCLINKPEAGARRVSCA
jgi:hypothetical protein